MSFSDYNETDLAAAEYVLGTLDAEQAAAFEQRLADDPQARQSLAEWEHRLARLGLDLEPVAPPDAVWARITRAIGAVREHDTSTKASADRVSAPPAANEAGGARRWRRLAIAASVVVVVLAGLWVSELPVWQPGGEPQAPSYAGMIYDKSTGMSWLVTSVDQGKKLQVQALGNYRIPADKMLRMWLKPVDGKPKLIGQLPHTRGHYTMTLSDSLRAKLGDHSKLVVSMEDRSRAGTTTPGGKIMWVSPLAHATG